MDRPLRALRRRPGSAPPVRVALVTTGDELLSGAILDTNAHWLTALLTREGLRVVSLRTIGDRSRAIREAVEGAAREARVVIVTGGLGPTRDDRTFAALSRLVGSPLRIRPEVVNQLEERFASAGRPMPRANLRQARIPASATVIPNRFGTAPAISLRHRGAVVYALPGVPAEMMGIASEELLPRLARSFPGRSPLELKRIRVAALAEAALQDRLAPLSAKAGIDVGFQASGGVVDVRVVAPRSHRTRVERLVEAIRQRLGPSVFAIGDASLEATVLDQLRSRGHSLAWAESCTGGLLGARLTSVPGSSDVAWGGWVTYSNDAKEHELGVSRVLIERHGAVSVPVARAMAEGARRRSATEWGVGITGVAGPGGGTAAKPVGTVAIAWSRRGTATRAGRFHFDGDRDGIRERAVVWALEGLRRGVLGLPPLEPDHA